MVDNVSPCVRTFIKFQTVSDSIADEIHVGDQKLIIGKGAPFDKVDAFFRANDLEYVTAEQYARAVLEAQPKSPVLSSGTIVAESYIYFPNGDILVVAPNYDEETRLSPILAHPEYAAKRHKQGLEFYLKPEPDEISILREKIANYDRTIAERKPVSRPIYDKTKLKLEDAIKDYRKCVKQYAESLKENSSQNPEEALEAGALFIPRNRISHTISTEKFDSEPLTKFLYGEYAKPLGEMLSSKGIRGVQHITVHPKYLHLNKITLPFCRPLWIHSTGYAMSISTQINLSEKNPVYGVFLNDEDGLEELDSDDLESAEDSNNELEDLEVPPDESQMFGTDSPTQVVADGLESLEKTPRKPALKDNEWLD